MSPDDFAKWCAGATSGDLKGAAKNFATDFRRWASECAPDDRKHGLHLTREEQLNIATIFERLAVEVDMNDAIVGEADKVVVELRERVAFLEKELGEFALSMQACAELSNYLRLDDGSMAARLTAVGERMKAAAARKP